MVVDFFKKEGLNLIYGPGATGKTTLLMQIIANYLKEKKRCLILDTEDGFSVERLLQILENKKELLDYLFLIKVKDLKELEEKISWVVDNSDKFSFIGIDSLGSPYRKGLNEDVKNTLIKMEMKCRILKQLSKEKPIIITNQVYSDFKGGVFPVGGKRIINFFDKIIELRKDPRIFVEHKPEENRRSFVIEDSGLRFS